MMQWDKAKVYDYIEQAAQSWKKSMIIAAKMARASNEHFDEEAFASSTQSYFEDMFGEKSDFGSIIEKADEALEKESDEALFDGNDPEPKRMRSE